MCSLGSGCASIRLSGASPEGMDLFDSSPLQHLKILMLPAATGKVRSCSSYNEALLQALVAEGGSIKGLVCFYTQQAGDAARKGNSQA